jgi:succinyl-diaminopimelate desuccinylase
MKQLSRTEAQTRVLKNIHREETTRLLRNLIRIPSVSGEEKDCADFVAEKLRATGIKVKIQRLSKNRPIVLGTVKGRKRHPALALEAHIDTVPPGNVDLWKYDPFGGEIVGDRIYGRGACDSKGSLASMMVAAEAIAKSGIELDGDLILVAPPDAEGLMQGAVRLVETGAVRRWDSMISGEATSLEFIVIAYKGTLRYDIVALGKQAHAVQPQKGVNAVYKMAKIISALEKMRMTHERHKLLGHPVFNVGAIEGGVGPALVPNYCRIKMDVRTVPGQSERTVSSDIHHALRKLRARDKELEYRVTQTLTGKAARVPVEVSPKEPVIGALVDASKDVVGKKPRIVGHGWSVTGSMIMVHNRTFGRPSGVTFGPGAAELAHVADENIGIRQVLDAAKIYAITALKLLL